ncbi:hypothetical protein [Tamaricihabitans halophyticus]|uniref:hypothetical protein n=1 Tax=Tamaricihabitans halophyticus TaxID=1262583 RepID=UPI001A9F2D46
MSAKRPSPRTASPPAVREHAAYRGLQIIDATCPLVSKVHAEARHYTRDGYTIA